MCGIVGYTGYRPAQPIIFNSLAKLEYRGYDSCGIALSDSGITIYKDAVRVAELARSIPNHSSPVGIGHTRWATHGVPCRSNAHPHTDCSGRIAVVHNGVISNFYRLKKQLLAEGHRFTSETDTEVIPHLIEKYYSGDLLNAVQLAIKAIEGSYAIIVLAQNDPALVFARLNSPLIIGSGDGERLIASDVTAILEYTNRVIYLENGDTGIITPEKIIIKQDNQPVIRTEQKAMWCSEQSQKHGYEHYMLKEIHEEPRVVRDSLFEYFTNINMSNGLINPVIRQPGILMVACGTSYHAALIARHVGESLTDLPFMAEIASEFNYYPTVHSTPLTIGITQSGETADTIKAMQRMKDSGSRILAITNVIGSTAARIADYTLYMQAGPEISVAATKSFIAQLATLFCFMLGSSKMESRLYEKIATELRRLPDKIQQVLTIEDAIADISARLAEYEYVIYIGRGVNYAVALEGALKLKEVSYIHSEAYAAGEIKHGPFALLTSNTPVVAIVNNDISYDAMITNIKEIKSRGSPVYAIVEENNDSIKDLVDFTINVPRTLSLLSPFINAVVVQLIAYYAAKRRNCPIDFPRNLAKSVTVE